MEQHSPIENHQTIPVVIESPTGIIYTSIPRNLLIPTNPEFNHLAQSVEDLYLYHGYGSTPPSTLQLSNPAKPVQYVPGSEIFSHLEKQEGGDHIVWDLVPLSYYYSNDLPISNGFDSRPLTNRPAGELWRENHPHPLTPPITPKPDPQHVNCSAVPLECKFIQIGTFECKPPIGEISLGAIFCNDGISFMIQHRRHENIGVNCYLPKEAIRLVEKADFGYAMPVMFIFIHLKSDKEINDIRNFLGFSDDPKSLDYHYHPNKGGLGQTRIAFVFKKESFQSSNISEIISSIPFRNLEREETILMLTECLQAIQKLRSGSSAINE